MITNYIKIALRNITRNKFYSLINIAGLAVGMACSILILLWVWDEVNFDQFNKGKENIYRIVADHSKWEWEELPISPGPLGTSILENVPEVDDMFRITQFDRVVFKYNENVFYESGGIIADPSIFSIFSFPFILGDPETALSTPQSIVISETLAKKYFGNDNPVGKSIEIHGKLGSVAGVFKNIPIDSHLQFDFVLNFEFIKEYSNLGASWGAFNFTTYVLLKKNEIRNLSEISEKITLVALDQECVQVKEGARFKLQPLSEIHLHQFGWQSNYLVLGDRNEVYIFTLVALFILLIACVNFINLSTARSVNRAKEVGLRKTIGAMKIQLIRQFLSESVLITFIAMVCALIIVELSIGGFNELSGKLISTDYSNIIFIAGLTGIFLITGFIAGIYPALYLSSFKPVRILKGEYFSGKRSITLRNFLVIFQFSLSIALIFINIVISQQVDYSKSMKLGYDRENLVYIPIIENLQSKYYFMKNELQKSKLVKNVSAHEYNFVSAPTPRAAGFKWEGMDENRERDLDLIFSGVDYNFFDMLEINVAEGRIFSEKYSLDKDGVILNEAAISDMQIKSPIGKWITLGKWKKTIVGVVKDVHFRSTRHEIEPRIYYLKDYSESASGIMLIKINRTNTQEALSFIEEEWSKINSVSPFEYGFIDEEYSNLYKSETRINTIFNYFTIIAIIISCLGLFGLASFLTERRKKEIGVRKVLGGSVKGIILLLSKEFVTWVLLANIIAWPVAYFAMNGWLEDFAYRINISLWPFLFSGLIAFLIAIATVSYQSIKAALANPVESLKYE